MRYGNGGPGTIIAWALAALVVVVVIVLILRVV